MTLIEIQTLIKEKKARLDELKAAKSAKGSQSARYRAGANAVRELDPDRAMSYDKMADQLDAQEQTEVNTTNPQTIRMKLFSSANSMSNQMSRMNADSDNFKRAKRMQNWMYEESNKDQPTLQMPLSVISGIKSDSVVDPTNVNEQNTIINGGTGKTVKDPLSKSDNSMLSNTSISNGSVQKEGNISKQAGDWFELIPEDGYDKPMLRSNEINVDNMPQSVRALYDARLKKWNSNNDSAKSRGASANKVKEANKIYTKFKPLYTKRAAGLKDIAVQLESLIEKYNNGDYALANFADLKRTMADGRMTDGDVSISTGLTGLSSIWQGIKSNLSGGNWANAKLTDKTNATNAINRIIDSYNQTVQGLKNPKFSGSYADQLSKIHEDQSYGAIIPTNTFNTLAKVSNKLVNKPLKVVRKPKTKVVRRKATSLEDF